MDFETTVKLHVYDTLAGTTHAPTAAEVAARLSASVAEVEAAFRGLASRRLLVLEPGTTNRIRMAPPFSGIETPFRVRVGERTYFANCIWDALGVAAALHRDARVEASDGQTGEPLDLDVHGGRPPSPPYAVHFAVPAASWWDDIVHT